MDYQQTTEWLFAQVPMFQNLGEGAYKPGLDTTLALANEWGNPHLKFPAIHIAGTNGKGSTAHTIAAILQSAGYNTALYTSPHLVDFRERIRVNGNPIVKDYVVDFIERFRNSPVYTLHPTFFELTTIMAFSYFAQENVDVAVIETGLGGRLDSTNILKPLVSIITNISLDHTALLGNTEEKIAFEKAGIIKDNTPVVIGEAKESIRKVFRDKAYQTKSEIVFAEDTVNLCGTIKTDCIKYEETNLGQFLGELTGNYQIANTRTILAALKYIKKHFAKIDNDSVKKGFAEVCELTGLIGRWMTIHKEPVHVVCDTGHNIGGWQYLGPRLKSISESGHRLHMVLGFVSDKDINAIVRQMPMNATYYFAKPSVSRGRKAEETAAAAKAAGIEGACFSSVADAYKKAMSDARVGDTVFIGGSTYVVADLLSYLS